MKGLGSQKKIDPRSSVVESPGQGVDSLGCELCDALNTA